VIAVLGPKGAGKTTLFRTLIGSEPAMGGRIAWSGRTRGFPSPHDLAACVAYVPQQSGHAPDLSVADYVMLGRIARKTAFARPAVEDHRAVERALRRLGLESLARRPLGRISGGERQLAAVARALAQQAGVLLLDEPTASLDFSNQQLVLTQVRSIVGDGLAVIFSTHQPDHAHQLADRVLALDGHGASRFGPSDEILSEAVLSELYGIPVMRVEARGHVLFSAVQTSRSSSGPAA
jgi:iron complex transport system ATP-binding protein